MAKGYWINHVEEIIDQEAFGKYVTKWNALVERGEAKMIAIGPVAKTQIGKKDMQFAAVVDLRHSKKRCLLKVILIMSMHSKSLELTKLYQ